MNIGILGSGDVAKALAKGFLDRGDSVMLGTRDAAKLQEWKTSAGERASVGSFEEAARFGEWIVLATLGTATVDIIAQVGPQAFSRKIVIDATNPLRFDGGVANLAYTQPSNGERIAKAISDARVVKAFNTVGNALMVHPDFDGARGVMFIAGDDAAAKREVAGLCEEWGWQVSDMGGVEASAYLEALCIVWVRHAVQTGSWTNAFTFVAGTSAVRAIT
jgi:8-hydroxy-5-deazaflavin:NADPH oxidoreductase